MSTYCNSIAPKVFEMRKTKCIGITCECVLWNCIYTAELCFCLDKKL